MRYLVTGSLSEMRRFRDSVPNAKDRREMRVLQIMIIIMIIGVGEGAGSE